jgi:uncharacterized protein
MTTEQSRPCVVITGGSGFVGTELIDFIETNYPAAWRVLILSRSKPTTKHLASSNVEHVYWDGLNLGEWVEQIRGCTHVVNLAGRSIDCRKNPERWDQVLRSRVDTTLLLGKAFKQIDEQPQCWVQMSATGIYGTPPTTVCDETASYGMGYLSEVAQRWEDSFEDACPQGTRGVVIRTAVVLGKTSGAFPILKRVAKLGLGGKMGSGKQGISWIHIHDLCAVITDAMTNDQRCGVYNTCTADPKSYVGFMQTIRKVVKQPIALPGPVIGLRIMCATLIDTDPDLILYGVYCQPKKLIDEGFEFKFPDLESAVRDLSSK